MCTRCLTSICIWDDVEDLTVRNEGEVEDVGGVVLAGQRVEHLAVNSDLDVLPLCVTHLNNTQILILIPCEDMTDVHLITGD